MSIKLNGICGDSIANAIVIDALDTVEGIAEERNYIDQLSSTLATGVESVQQNLIFEDGKPFDKFIIRFEDGLEKILYFDITSFFGKISNPFICVDTLP